jgi:hypothetical protein
MFYYLGKLVYSILANIYGLGSEKDYILKSYHWFFLPLSTIWVGLVCSILHEWSWQLKNDLLCVVGCI